MQNELKKRMELLSRWLLELHKNRDDDEGVGKGWPAVDTNDTDGILTTASAVRVFIEYENIDINTIKSAIDFIINTQGRNGGWALISGADNPSTISTAEALQALAAIYSKVKGKDDALRKRVVRSIKSSVSWLLNIQNDDGGWSSVVSEDRSISSNSCAYATSVVLIAFDYCSSKIPNIRELTNDFTSNLEEAFKYLELCRTESGFWKADEFQKQPDIIISTIVAYVYSLYYQEEVLNITNLFRSRFTGSERMSLHVGKTSILLPYGDVQFYINGAFWICKLFARYNESYIGYIKYIKYILQNENPYYTLTDLSNNYVHGQCTWVSIDTLELGRLFLGIPDETIVKSVIEASAYIANGFVLKNDIENEYSQIFSLIENNDFNCDDFVVHLVNYTSKPQDVVFCETFIKCLATIDWLSDDKTIVAKYEDLLIDKLSNVSSYEVYDQFSDERQDYNGFSVLKHIRAYARILNIIHALVDGMDNTAISFFFSGELGEAQFVSNNTKYQLFKLVSFVTTNSSDLEQIEREIQNTRAVIKGMFNPTLLDNLFNQLQQTIIKNNDNATENENSIRFQPIEKIINTGIPVPANERLFGREEMLQEACRQISKGTSIAITGDFRIGKTSFITHMKEILKTEYNYLTCYIDFTTPLTYDEDSGSREIESFFKVLTERLRETIEEAGAKTSALDAIKKKLKDFYDSLDSVSVVAVSIDRANSANNKVMELYKHVQELIQDINDNFLKPEDKYLVIIVDEFTSVSNLEQTSVVISRICRTITQNATRIRLVIASQYILASKTQHERVPLTTVLKIYQLQGYTVSQIKKYIKEKEPKISIQESAVYELRKITGGNPYWLGLILNSIIEQLNKKRTYIVTKEIVSEAVVTFLHSQDGMSKLEWFYDVTIENNELYAHVLLLLSNPSIDSISSKELRSQLKEIVPEKNQQQISDAINVLIKKGIIYEHDIDVDTYNQSISMENGLLKFWIYNNYGGI